MGLFIQLCLQLAADTSRSHQGPILTPTPACSYHVQLPAASCSFATTSSASSCPTPSSSRSPACSTTSARQGLVHVLVYCDPQRERERERESGPVCVCYACCDYMHCRKVVVSTHCVCLCDHTTVFGHLDVRVFTKQALLMDDQDERVFTKQADERVFTKQAQK